MRRFEIVQSDTDTTTSHAGFALVGRALHHHTRLGPDLEQIPLRHGIAHADCVTSYVGLIASRRSASCSILTRAMAQYVGRLHREHHAKREVIVYDYVDSGVAMLARMALKRQTGYRSLGYEIAIADPRNPLPASSGTT